MEREIVHKALTSRKCDFAIGDGVRGYIRKQSSLSAGIAALENNAANNPDGDAAEFMGERNARIERYANQASSGRPIQFEPKENFSCVF